MTSAAPRPPGMAPIPHSTHPQWPVLSDVSPLTEPLEPADSVSVASLNGATHRRQSPAIELGARRRRLGPRGGLEDCAGPGGRCGSQRAIASKLLHAHPRASAAEWFMRKTHCQRTPSLLGTSRSTPTSPTPPMPRHQPTPVHADWRLNRPNPDALPPFRQCPTCRRVLRLDADSFYEDRSRYPWNLSRFSSRCKTCAVRADAARAKDRRAEKTARALERRRLVQANRRTAGLFASPPSLAIQAERDRTAASRKIQMAWVKRQFNRRRGPYRDPIKALIKERVIFYFKRRMRNDPSATSYGWA